MKLFVAVTTTAVAALALAACGPEKTAGHAGGPTPAVTTTTTKEVPGPVTTTKVTVTKSIPGPTKVVTKKVPETYTKFGDGTYVVGTDIRSGVYKTSGPGSADIMDSCYWAVLNTLDTSDIKGNGNINGPTTIQVSGKALEVSGGCTWAKVG